MYKNAILPLSFLLVSCTSLFGQNEPQRTIAFDLGDTLFVTDKKAAFLQVGLLKFAAYLVAHPKLCAHIDQLSRAIEQRFFTVLNAIEPRDKDESDTYSPNGFLLPQLMCTWMKGKRSSTDTYALIKHTLAAHPEYCSGTTEQKVMLAMARLTFTPEIFASTRKLAPYATKLVQFCKQQGHRIAVLSNWDPASFKLIQHRFPELFDLVDDIVISGHTGVLKPDQAAYSALLEKHPSSPAHSYIFIDDRPENIQACQAIGMQGILCPLYKGTPDLKYVYKELHNSMEASLSPTYPHSSSISC